MARSTRGSSQRLKETCSPLALARVSIPRTSHSSGRSTGRCWTGSEAYVRASDVLCNSLGCAELSLSWLCLFFQLVFWYSGIVSSNVFGNSCLDAVHTGAP